MTLLNDGGAEQTAPRPILVENGPPRRPSQPLRPLHDVSRVALAHNRELPAPRMTHTFACALAKKAALISYTFVLR